MLIKMECPVKLKLLQLGTLIFCTSNLIISFVILKVVPKISERLIEFHISSAPDIEDLNIVEDGSSSKESKAPVPDHGRKQNLENAARLQTGSPGVSTVAVKRKPRTQVAESLAKVILQI